MCVCVCVCVRDRQTDRQTDIQTERVFNFCLFVLFSYESLRTKPDGLVPFLSGGGH